MGTSVVGWKVEAFPVPFSFSIAFKAYYLHTGQNFPIDLSVKGFPPWIHTEFHLKPEIVLYHPLNLTEINRVKITISELKSEIVM